MNRAPHEMAGLLARTFTTVCDSEKLTEWISIIEKDPMDKVYVDLLTDARTQYIHDISYMVYNLEIINDELNAIAKRRAKTQPPPPTKNEQTHD